jgi:hypothetical protein
VIRIAHAGESHEEKTYLPPCGDLLVGPDARDIEIVARSFMGDISRLADDQRARYACTCGIVLDLKISGRVLGVCPISGQGCHHDSVPWGYRADLDGPKEL